MMIKNFEEFQTIGKDNMDAAVASATALTTGFQTIANEFAEFARKSFEDSTNVFEKAFEVKSVEKAVDLQTKFAKSAYENYVAGIGKFGEMYLETAKQAYKPLEERAGTLSDTVKETAKKAA